MKNDKKSLALIPEERVAQAIFILRGQKVMLDSDLAKLFGVSTSRLNEQVQRNKNRFPLDFAFRLSISEARNLISQNATSSWGGRRKLPLVFTEHGALMAGNILKSSRAVEMSVIVVRAFVRMRQMLSTNIQLTHKLQELDRKVSGHDENIKDIITAIRRLMKEPEPKRNPIGFGLANKDKKNKK